jgi:hypothetical protein
MDEAEYLLVREAMIALMCVGDKITRIRPVKGYNHRIHDHYTYYVLTIGYISKIINEDVFKVTSLYGDISVQYFKTIDVYKGQLYIWSSRATNYKERMEELAERIESEDTKNDYFS